MKQAWVRLKQHWIRHLLAALQVAVGVALVTAVFVDVVPMWRQTVASGGADTFQVRYGGTTPEGGTFWRSAFHLDDVTFAREQLTTVQAVSVYNDLFSPLLRVADDLFLLRSAASVSPGYAEIAGLHMVAGRFFTEDDVVSGDPQVTVMSSQLASLLFPNGDALGAVVNWRPDEEGRLVRGFSTFGGDMPEGLPGVDLMVVGVYEGEGDVSPTASLLSRVGGGADMLLPATGERRQTVMRTSFTPSGDVDAVEWVSQTSGETYQHIIFKVLEGHGTEALAEVEAVLSQRIQAREGGTSVFDDGTEYSLRIEPLAGAVTTGARLQLQGVLMLGAMGVAALVVAGFSVFTTFLASVAERTRSIGLARALGATRGRVVREVVGEAVLLCSIGGVIGAVLAYPLRTYVMGSLVGRNVAVGPLDVIITMAVVWLLAAGIGALAALYPGWSVGNLMPAQAFEEDGR